MMIRVEVVVPTEVLLTEMSNLRGCLKRLEVTLLAKPRHRRYGAIA
jgi:hypothetical protein